MKRILAVLAVALVAALGSLANARVAAGSNFPPTCQFNDGFYKYAGLHRVEGSLPTWSKVQGNITSQWWGFNNATHHTADWVGVLNVYPGGEAWVQAGLIAGYDVWGNPLDTNYPYGSYNDNYHPNNYTGNGPSYTPNGVAVDTRYSENNIAGVENITYIGPAINGNGITVAARNDGGGYFSMVDQNNNNLGPNVTHIFIGASGTYHTEIMQESASNSLGASYCAWQSVSVSNLNSTAANNGFWTNSNGCNGSTSNTGDPNCAGGAGTANAPLDFLAYCPGGANGSHACTSGEWHTSSETLVSLSLFCQEGINGFGPLALLTGGHAPKAPPLAPQFPSSTN